MKNHFFKSRPIGVATISGLLAVVSACGGGGGANPGPNNSELLVTAKVSTVSVGSLMYGKSAIFTVTGTNLNQGQGVKVSATGCQTPTLMTTPPAANSSTTAHFECNDLAMGAGTFVVTAVGVAAPLWTENFAVPAPQVTMALKNGGNGVDGTIVLTLFPDKTPLTVKNFLAYVNNSFYNDTVIHAVAPGYAIQGGGAIVDPASGGSLILKPTSLESIPLEVNKGLRNIEGTIAMTYNRFIGTKATSQFFINLRDNSDLFDPNPGFPTGYAVFGEVSGGADTVASIGSAPCIANALLGIDGTLGCTPTPYVIITKATQTR